MLDPMKILKNLRIWDFKLFNHSLKSYTIIGLKISILETFLLPFDESLLDLTSGH
jgi:hypothetical protein